MEKQMHPIAYSSSNLHYKKWMFLLKYSKHSSLLKLRQEILSADKTSRAAEDVLKEFASNVAALCSCSSSYIHSFPGEKYETGKILNWLLVKRDWPYVFGDNGKCATKSCSNKFAKRSLVKTERLRILVSQSWLTRGLSFFLFTKNQNNPLKISFYYLENWRQFKILLPPIHF